MPQEHRPSNQRESFPDDGQALLIACKSPKLRSTTQRRAARDVRQCDDLQLDALVGRDRQGGRAGIARVDIGQRDCFPGRLLDRLREVRDLCPRSYSFAGVTSRASR